MIMRGAVAAASIGIMALTGCGTATRVSQPTESAQPTASAPPASATRLTSQAIADLTDIRKGNCDPVAARFDAQMTAKLSAIQLCAAWITYGIEFGTFQSAGTPTTTQLGAATVVRVPLRMTTMPGEFRITYEGGKIAGIYELKTGVPL